VVRVTSLGKGLGRVDLRGEGIGKNVLPGRFAMVEAPGHPECILLRPYSYYVSESADHIALLIRDVGKGSGALLRAAPDDEVVVLGPLGNAFPTPAGKVWAIAGGVGAGPFGALATHPEVEILFGARGVYDAGFAESLRALGGRVTLATDDGSGGFHGTVVALLEEKLAKEKAPDALYTCGPGVMMAAVAKVARRRQIPCWVSLEERMGCGIGICRGCAHPDASGGWRCICVDGPVYRAEEIFAAMGGES